MEIRKTGILLRKLRDSFKDVARIKDSLQAYIIPHNDGHLNEYISARDERLAFISGFTGSYGTAIVTETKAVLWTDGRYTLQARSQMDDNWSLFTEGLADSPTQSGWLVGELSGGRGQATQFETSPKNQHFRI
ncbi:xaa-Pro aminopeptidase 1-like [Nilaparvata lugens]|uniref:xaa-Pro aminopeptidase 1-like n=1 Tax=Nilaparvata lugens TaxID=108931 RepID=UPI00193E1049|nr:xaa-Pro aminopeptidase 1-like [Nilaparvata lugens]